MAGVCNGTIEPERIHAAVGIEVKDTASLREAFAAFFEKSARFAIAIKSQHAYNRTLLWRERTDAEAETVLQKQLAGDELTEEERLCLGDWNWARGVELAIEHNKPFKIHTGYYAGQGFMPMERIAPAQMWRLLSRYPKARLVLMHLAYPYQDELIALAKQYPNVYIDFCWAWSLNPYRAMDAVHSLIHSVPSIRYSVSAAIVCIPMWRWVMRHRREHGWHAPCRRRWIRDG